MWEGKKVRVQDEIADLRRQLIAKEAEERGYQQEVDKLQAQVNLVRLKFNTEFFRIDAQLQELEAEEHKFDPKKAQLQVDQSSHIRPRRPACMRHWRSWPSGSRQPQTWSPRLKRRWMSTGLGPSSSTISIPVSSEVHGRKWLSLETARPARPA